MQFPGKMIVVEGPDCCGKSTQRDKIAEFMEQQGFEVIRTREPGGTPYAEEIRELCKKPSDEPKDPRTEMLMMFASRNQHLEKVIWPALKRGAVVVCDRFTMSSYAYQVAAGGAQHQDFTTLNRMVVGSFMPELTLVFNVSEETTYARKFARATRDGNVPDHFDDKDDDFKAKIRSFYDQASSGSEFSNVFAINANVGIDQVFAQVLPHLMALTNEMKKRPKPQL